MTLETDVARHYTTDGLIDRIDAALRAMGADPDRPSFDDLKPVDEFHTGGIEATTHLLDQLDITPDTLVADLGSGLGGTARHIVHRYGATVQGVDLTPAFVAAARDLNGRLGLGDRITLAEGSLLDLPWPDASADLAVMFHVGMNIADKPALFAQVARVLRPGGRFALFDVMRDEAEDDLALPVPWSETAETSHVEAPSIYRRAAHAAGLEQMAETDRRAFAMDFYDRVSRKIAAEGPPTLGIHILMGDTAPDKIANYLANIEARRITPVEMIFRKPGGDT
ncbi:MAG: class I SAM-dependent methyltransferase [Pseudomonadota bacterium]